ncbi:MAG: thiamine pyrophosphate-binding protein [Oligoflexales bacterium]|nr:thiamine pyrophosphate-binding protein [Oligoflexales bacterium]
MKIKVSDFVFDFLAQKGIRHVFFLPGGGCMHLVDSLGKCKKIDSICMLHEQAVSVAAQSYAMHTENLGVGLVTTGPGGTNTITGVSAAWIDSIPCLFISGQVKRPDLMKGKGIRQLGIQEVDIVSIVQSITKYATTVMDPKLIKYNIEKACYLALNGRMGPVWLDIPLDVQGAIVEEEELKGFNKEELQERTLNGDQLRADIEKLINLINNSERPVIVAGDGIKLAKARIQFLELIEKLNIPVITTWKAMDLLYEEHPLYVGRGGTLGERSANFAQQNSDLILAIGSKMDFSQTGFDTKSFGRAAKKVVVDIDENEIRKLDFHVDVEILSDAKLFLDEFLRMQGKIIPVDRSSWREKIKHWRKAYPIFLQKYKSGSGPINPYHLVEELSNESSADDVISPCCAGTAAEFVFQGIKLKKGQKFITNHGLGPMGFDLPASIAASLANPGKKVICITGDGGFQLNIQELATLKRLNLPVKIFIMNNNGYSSIKIMQDTHFNGNHIGNDPESGLLLPDIVCIARAYGLMAVRIEDAAELSQKIRSVLDINGPVVCDVVVDSTAKVAPKVSSKRMEDGSMVSMPLENQWPFLDLDELKSNMIVCVPMS